MGGDEWAARSRYDITQTYEKPHTAWQSGPLTYRARTSSGEARGT